MEEPKINLSLSIDFDTWFYLLEKPYALNQSIWKIVFEYLSREQREIISTIFKTNQPSYILIQIRFNDTGRKIKTLFKDYYN